MKKTDILVLTNDNYDFTGECANFLIKNTSNDCNIIFIINQNMKEQVENISKIFNENVKFIYVNDKLKDIEKLNIAIDNSEHNDIIILNSNIKVSSEWDKKIINCAYSSEYIATVTPIINTNNLINIGNQENFEKIPLNINFEEYSKLIEKCSEKKYPEIITANINCMFIKRSIINEIGRLDELNFPNCYGADNDFSFRAFDHGYINVLCDDVFVYNNTLGEKKIDRNIDFLRKRYLNYLNKVEYYLGLNPVKSIQEKISINTQLYGKKKILYVINEWNLEMNFTAGASLHLKDIIIKLSNDYACFVLCPDKSNHSIINLYLYVEKTCKKLCSIRTYNNSLGQIAFHNKTYADTISKLFEIYRFDILHVHSLLFQPMDIVNIAKDFNLYTIITLHDLYMLCPSVNMVYNGRYCKNVNSEDCRNCFKQRQNIDEDILQLWRNECYKVLKYFDKIIAPSYSTRDIYIQAYNDLKIDVIEHGVNKIDIINTNNKVKSERFNVAFVGVLAEHKGGKIINELIKINSNNNIHIFGKIIDNCIDADEGLFINHGEYKRQELPQLLNDNDIDLVCIFSVCPETYSYTLTETYMACVPVLCFNLGAVSERVLRNDTGWSIDLTDNAQEILDRIKEIELNKADYDNKKNNITKLKLKSVTKMQEEYNEIYQDCCDSNNSIVDLFKIYSLKNYIEQLMHDMGDIELDIEQKEKYIKVLEKCNEDYSMENSHKENHIKLLENELIQRKNEINSYKNEITIYKDEVIYYKNMRTVKLSTKIRNIKEKFNFRKENK